MLPPSMTFDWDFKVAVFFGNEYLRGMMRGMATLSPR